MEGHQRIVPQTFTKLMNTCREAFASFGAASGALERHISEHKW